MNSEESILHQPHNDEHFAVRNVIAFVSLASRSVQSPVEKD
jgi:hypothetical protein